MYSSAIEHEPEIPEVQRLQPKGTALTKEKFCKRKNLCEQRTL